jgi:hypothetical protein
MSHGNPPESVLVELGQADDLEAGAGYVEQVFEDLGALSIDCKDNEIRSLTEHHAS